MKMHVLGTGNALVTECYNTCYVLTEGEHCLLVDGGGGNGLLTQLKRASIRWQDIREIFVTHKHVDHIMGIVWMLRMITQTMAAGKYQGEVSIYGHDEVIRILTQMANDLLQPKQAAFLNSRVHMIEVRDGETRTLMGRETTFFDIHSTKAKQFGYCMRLDDGRLCCCGDEPYTEVSRSYAEGAKWLLHEAFCLNGEADIFHPYEKHHSTAQDAARLAETLGVQNLLLYHTEETHLADRKALYTAEAKSVYGGNVFVPDDLDVIDIE